MTHFYCLLFFVVFFSSPGYFILMVNYYDSVMSVISCAVSTVCFKQLFLWSCSASFSSKLLVLTSTKIAQTVLLRCIKWLPELKKKKNLKQTSHYTLGGFEANFRGLFYGWLYQNFSNHSALPYKMVTRAKNRKTFELNVSLIPGLISVKLHGIVSLDDRSSELLYIIL